MIGGDRLRFRTMAVEANLSRPIILCPLEFERQMLERIELDASCDLVCIGPGADRVVEWAQRHAGESRPIVLAGLAGGLSPEFAAGSAHVVDQVVDENGEDTWSPTLGLAEQPMSGEIIITSTRAPLTGRLARRLMNRETGGMLIDLESVAFAASAQKFRWSNWGIVRGVSDDVTTLLPEGLDEWVGETGHTRWGQVMRSLLLRPQLIPKVVELRRHSTEAMKGVAELLRRLLELPAA